MHTPGIVNFPSFFSAPNITRFPALVAGFFFSLIMQTPGIVNFPSFFSAPGISPVKASHTVLMSFRFRFVDFSIAAYVSLRDIGMAPEGWVGAAASRRREGREKDP